MSQPELVSEQPLHGSSQLGLDSGPLQNGTQVPWFVWGSTSQHIENASQSSIPETPDPSTMQGSPGPAGSGAMGEHRVAFHAPIPVASHGMHFSPCMQGSPVHKSHSRAEGVSSSMMKRRPPVDDVVMESGPVVVAKLVPPVEVLWLPPVPSCSSLFGAHASARATTSES
jgi:hypothetical protein